MLLKIKKCRRLGLGRQNDSSNTDKIKLRRTSAKEGAADNMPVLPLGLFR